VLRPGPRQAGAGLPAPEAGRVVVDGLRHGVDLVADLAAEELRQAVDLVVEELR
jgi:hypothetical protein